MKTGEKTSIEISDKSNAPQTRGARYSKNLAQSRQNYSCRKGTAKHIP
jgi:hypothetical protein